MRAVNSWGAGMQKTGSSSRRRTLLTLCILSAIMAIANTAAAEPGDAAAVAQARKDYTEAMKGHDKGLQNAMRAELAAQLAKSRERARENKRRPSSTAQPANSKSSAG